MKQIPYFNMIAFRILKDHSTGQKILRSNHFYYFLKGYSIVGEELVFNENEACMCSLYDDYMRKAGSHLYVTVSAVVGANGSGKSTIVEFVLRLLNNLAASIFGEKSIYPKMEHLFYVDNLFGELYYTVKGIPHLLRIRGDEVELFNFRKQRQEIGQEKDNSIRFIRYAKPLYKRNSRKEWTGQDRFYSKWRKNNKTVQKIANHIFYSFVSNYSLYAYNPADFTEEWNGNNEQVNKQNSLRRIRETEKEYQEKGPTVTSDLLSKLLYVQAAKSKCWLDGIFETQGDIQIPIRISPYRVSGSININEEEREAEERLVSLLFRDKGYTRINGHLNVIGFEFKQLKNHFGLDFIHTRFNLKMKERAYSRLRVFIAECWRHKYRCDFSKTDSHPIQEIALEYLAFQTLEIASSYNQYSKYVTKLRGLDKWFRQKHKRLIKGLIDSISNNTSHITTKLRQTLCFLVRGNYLSSQVSYDEAVKISRDSLRSMREDYRMGCPLLFTKIEDVLPAPFIKVNILLKEDNGGCVAFNKLSSGEKQQIFSIAAILYHLLIIDSSASSTNNKFISYKQVALILEEIELYYHPELQRELLMYLLDGIRQIHFSYIQAVSILLVTHSPFVLSDLPASNIMTLKDGVAQDGPLQSFGANIHDLLNSGFFMKEGSRGKFAEYVIDEIVKILQLYSRKTANLSDADRILIDNNPKEKVYRLIMTIDEPIIRNVLLENYRSVFRVQTKEERIAELERELEKLKQEIN